MEPISKLAKELDKEVSLQLYRKMVTIRQFEEVSGAAYRRGEFWGPTHSSAGEEAVDAGVCAALEPGDKIVGYHRSHGLFIAKGSQIKPLMAELFGKVTGTNKGKGGSMHLSDRAIGGMCSSGVLASSLPVAVGVALALKKERKDQVCVVGVGDGSFEEGQVGESMNLASLWKVPLVFLLYNNKYFQVLSARSRSSATLLSDRAIGYNIPRAVVDGQDVNEVYRAANAAVARARRGEGPSLIEAMTYRYQAQAARAGLGGDEDFRPLEEREYWFNRDPIKLFRVSLLAAKMANPEELDVIEQEVKVAVQEAVDYARKSPYPDVDEMLTDTYVRPVYSVWNLHTEVPRI
jgi:TPP-dependent pyruvate/acetoin dehydrogenase alpha subunit